MNYKKGDKVTIRSYESMRDEYRVAISGEDEVLRNGFSIHMKYLCGNTYKITYKNRGEYGIADEIWRVNASMFEEE